MKIPFFHKLMNSSTNYWLTSKAASAAAAPRVLTRSSSSTHSISTSCTSATDPDLDNFGDDDLHGNDQEGRDFDDDVHGDVHERRKVRFAESQNEFYENHEMTAEQVRSLWYTKTDFQVFKQAVWDTVHDIVHCNHIPNHDENNETTTESAITTLQALGDSYLGFCQVQSAADIFTVMENCHQIPHLEDIIGLDRLLVKRVMIDRMVRKRRLQRQILSWQDHPPASALACGHKKGHHHNKKNNYTDPDQRADFLRQLSRLESQPSRLYAHHIAQCALRSEGGAMTL